MREWKPGDVGVSRHGRCLVVDFNKIGCRDAHSGYGRHVHYGDGDWGTLSDVRPLVVIDPEDREQIERLLCLFHRAERTTPEGIGNMQRALRSLIEPPKPPKPEEPTGLGAVVEDSEGVPWVRTHIDFGAHWRRGNFQGTYRTYDQIDAVKVLSEGVPS